MMIEKVFVSGNSQLIYNLFQGFAGIVALIYCIFMCKKYDLKRFDAVVVSILGVVMVYLWAMFEAWAETGFKSWGAKNTVRGILAIPIVLYPLSKFFKVKYTSMLDFSAPILLLVQGLGHIGCIFTGCCHGFPSENGIFNPMTGTTLFPIQLVESAVSLAIFAIVLIVTIKTKYNAHGLTFPLMLVLFGFTRFACEFARDNEKVAGNLSSLAIHCLVMAIVGAIWLCVAAVVYKKKKRSTPDINKPINSLPENI